MVFWPSSLHKAAKTMVVYNIERPFALRHPTYNFGPTLTMNKVEMCSDKNVLLTWIPLKYADGENRLLSLFRYD
jgi:hypothetical protein